MELPTLQKDGYELISGLVSHHEAPKTFWVPTEAEKEKVGKGSLIKLNFNILTIDAQGNEQMDGERMWVIVVERDDDWFTGILDNQPSCTDEMKAGLVLHFKAEYIINIYETTVDLESDKYKEYRDILKKTVSPKPDYNKLTILSLIGGLFLIIFYHSPILRTLLPSRFLVVEIRHLFYCMLSQYLFLY